MSDDLTALVTGLAQRAKDASRVLANASSAQKNAVLRRAADALRGAAGDRVIEANARDMMAAEQMGLSKAMLDRLQLDRSRLDAVADGLEQVVSLPDPVGALVEERVLENGLRVGKMRAPLGLIGIIYESRPNVTADAASLCLKSGNAVLLRGGKEAFHSNTAIAEVFTQALADEGLPAEAVTLLPTTDRQATLVMIGLDGIVDMVIPRGGEGLIRFVAEHAKVPVIQHYKGVCHVFVDRSADPDMALEIALNAKVQRPGVCNAMETLLVDAAVAPTFLPKLGAAMGARGVELHADDRAAAHLNGVKPASEADWDTEYLDLILNVGVVDGIDAALEHVAKHGSNHTEAIVTKDAAHADRWLREVDASLVLVNASTRFNDGFALGLGAEIGISTTKLHAYGPMGLAELCTLKWVGQGEGQVRQ
ncbi:MAG: glutamate-5-semialdehyde dehydrogenase [Deltaproteobacteria bacterium]|nr:glutamate-5-semialdehyde dehydrogenase [Deltaproteobacteria bacterium]NND28874.1 glutamate-5-semialdehyde dehydrogenase [Myxococcales bacterium]MBT8464806.1 glutamate-5-semialdehyde dehydrogenase [Deltaproteobacteria bacterium]NNK06364.1 glutamate-5-semialdehyde dehydrogenase [Myxococcales bacterium]NNK42181.1 glutamate-5-semialdehyde dehydrogenase [Myxococcales bacterium]